jgi:hypothetical protein
MSEGIVSGLRDSGEGYGVIQTTAAISPGSSGGGLFNARGQLVGITTYKIKGGENLNFAIPVNFIRGMLATTAKFTLIELAAKYPATDAPAVGAGGTGNPSETAAVTGGIPRLADLYATPDGTMVLFEQEGESAHATWSNSKGEVYGHTAFVWNAAKNAFAGNGILKQVRRCGRNDREFDFAVAEEIYIVNERVISNRWMAPMAIDCSTGAVKSYQSKEQLWSVPQK